MKVNELKDDLIQSQFQVEGNFSELFLSRIESVIEDINNSKLKIIIRMDDEGIILKELKSFQFKMSISIIFLNKSWSPTIGFKYNEVYLSDFTFKHLNYASSAATRLFVYFSFKNKSIIIKEKGE